LLIFNNNNYPVLDYLFLFKESKKKKSQFKTFLFRFFYFFCRLFERKTKGKTMLLYKQKKNQVAKGKRFLLSVTVLGSAGPIRFVVNEEELVAAVIDTALKSYAREGRLPILGSDLNDFLLYCRNAASDGKLLVPKPQFFCVILFVLYLIYKKLFRFCLKLVNPFYFRRKIAIYVCFLHVSMI
jgi:hypothetical protein